MGVAAVVVVGGVGTWGGLADYDEFAGLGLPVFLENCHHAGRDIDGALAAGAFGGAEFGGEHGNGIFREIHIFPK